MDTISTPVEAFAKESRASRSTIIPMASLLAREDIRNCLLLAAIPITMSIVNSSWLYSPISSLDPWYSVAYFIHYSDPTFLNWYYKIARLSWIIPGFVAYHVFQPVVANYLLHMGCLVVSAVFFYLTVARLFGSTIALATAVCLVVFTPFHGSGGWDYQNAGAGAYYILAFYFLTTGSLSGNTRTFIWAGAAYAAALHCTLGFVNMVPILVLHCLTTYRHKFGQLPSPRLLVMAGIWFLFGAIVLTILLALINLSVGRNFLFFKPLLELAVSFIRDNRHQQAWWLPWSSKWFLETNNLNYIRVDFAALLVCTVSAVIGLVRGRFNLVALSLQLQYILIAVLWIAWQSVGQTALQPEYFAYPIYPVMFFGLAALPATWQPVGKFNHSTILFGAFLAMVAAGSLAVAPIGVTLLRLVGQHVELALTASALLFVSLFAAGAARPLLTAGAVVAFAASNVLGAAVTGGTKFYAYDEPCKDRAGAFRALIDSNRFLTRFVPDSGDMFVWWNEDEVLHDQKGCTMRVSYFARSMVSFGLDYLAPPWSGMPDVDALPPVSISAIVGPRRIGIVTSEDLDVKRLAARYTQGGVKLALEGQTIIRTSRFSFLLYVLGVDTRRELSGTVINLALHTLQAHPGSTLSGHNGEVVLTTSAQQWAYAASSSLSLPVKAAGPAVVHVRLQVEQGKLGIGVLARGNASEMLAEQAADISSNPIDIYLDLADVASAESIVLRSWSPNGVASRAQILSIATVLEREPQRPVSQP